MPNELFDMWLKPEIEFRGWPFTGNESAVSDPAWSMYLRDLPPSFWQEVRWQQVSKAFVGVTIEQRALDIAHKIAEFGRELIETGTAKQTIVKGSVEKVVALARIIKKEKKFPKPVVCLVQGNEWWLIDGQHRLGALFMLSYDENFQFDCWLGTHAL